MSQSGSTRLPRIALTLLGFGLLGMTVPACGTTPAVDRAAVAAAPTSAPPTSTTAPTTAQTTAPKTTITTTTPTTAPSPPAVAPQGALGVPAPGGRARVTTAPGRAVAPAPAPRPAPKPAAQPVPKPAPAPAPAPAPKPAPAATYANCSAAKAAGAAPLYRGQPGYSSKLDRDGDGIACEK
jgi:outer membrane biosynthesis protein TonB